MCEQQQSIMGRFRVGVWLDPRIWVPVANISGLLPLGGCGGKFWLFSHMAVFGHLGSPFGVSELFSEPVNFPVGAVICWHAPPLVRMPCSEQLRAPSWWTLSLST